MHSKEKLIQAKKKLEEATILCSEYVEDNGAQPHDSHVAVDKAIDRIFESACWIGLAVDSVSNSQDELETEQLVAEQ